MSGTYCTYWTGFEHTRHWLAECLYFGGMPWLRAHRQAQNYHGKLDRAQALADRSQFSPGATVGPYRDINLAYADTAFLKYSLGIACHVGYFEGDYHIIIDEDRTSYDVS